MSQNKNQFSKNITRKDAIKKMGSYAAFAALGTMIMLNPQKTQAVSGPPPPNGGFPGDGGASNFTRNKNRK